jgi:hypothetical protein
MIRLRAFLREDQPFLGLYSWGWVIWAGVIVFAMALMFGVPDVIGAIIWHIFSALVLGAAAVALLVVLGIVLILTCGYSK